MKTPTPQTIVIIGAVAGGASCATRLRRMNESAEIILLERGPFASFANCGLPYHVGGVIEDREKLLTRRIFSSPKNPFSGTVSASNYGLNTKRFRLIARPAR